MGQAGVVYGGVEEEVTTAYLDIVDAFDNLGLSTKQTVRRLEYFHQVLQDMADNLHAQSEGQWPDKFTLLNRYVRTGLRPPFIFND